MTKKHKPSHKVHGHHNTGTQTFSSEKEKLQEEFNQNLAALRHLLKASDTFISDVKSKITDDLEYKKWVAEEFMQKQEAVQKTREKLEKNGQLSEKEREQYAKDKEYVRNVSHKIVADKYFRRHALKTIRRNDTRVKFRGPDGRSMMGFNKKYYFEFTAEDRKKLETAINIIINDKRYENVDKNPDLSAYETEYAEQDRALFRNLDHSSMDIMLDQHNMLNGVYKAKPFDKTVNSEIYEAYEIVKKAEQGLFDARRSINGIHYETILKTREKIKTEQEYDRNEAKEYPSRREKLDIKFSKAKKFASGQISVLSEKATKIKTDVLLKIKSAKSSNQNR